MMIAFNGTVKIEQARFFQISTSRFPYPVSDSTLGPFTEFPVGLLELTTSAGCRGYGLCPVGRISIELLEETFLPLLFGEEIALDGIEEFWTKCIRRIRNIGAGYTHLVLAGIDIALWDLAAKHANEPLARLLGAEQETLPVYGSNGWTNHETPQLVESMTELAGRGFTTLKMKVGRAGGTRIDEDIERVRLVRRAIGDQIGLAVDANQCWNVADALRFADGVANENILWFEEPIAAHDFLAHKELAARSPIKLAAGECLTNAFAFETLAELNGLTYFQPELTRIGGITGFLQVARVAQKSQKQIVSGGFAHLICSAVAAAPTGMMSEYLVPFMDTFAEVWAERPRIEGGRWLLPQTSGHGLVPDMDYVTKHSAPPVVFRLQHQAGVRAY